METMRAPITVVIPTLNEASQISECVRHLSWVDDIVVADGGSSDGTQELAAAAGARVLERTGPTIAAQRNAAIAVSRHQWVLALDADERVGPDLAREIAAAVAQPAHEVYAIRRRSVYLGRVISHGGWGSDWVLRLFQRQERFVERRVHEALQARREFGRLVATLDHVPYRTLGHHIEKLDRYATWAALDLADQGRRAGFTDLLLRPPARFLRMYLLQGGVLDGWRGAVMCGLTAVNVFLKYARLWELETRRKT
ncbi:MAG TPA: glycosyltransferase family 2 protein [Gemmatimonadales bacterium]|nr:glycosyltransferase family 2 protein [Gemmatimonadales bacterium]